MPADDQVIGNLLKKEQQRTESKALSASKM